MPVRSKIRIITTRQKYTIRWQYFSNSINIMNIASNCTQSNIVFVCVFIYNFETNHKAIRVLKHSVTLYNRLLSQQAKMKHWNSRRGAQTVDYLLIFRSSTGRSVIHPDD